MKEFISYQDIYTKSLQNIDCTTLKHVLWLGGSPCSGKSSITDILAKQYDIQVYHVDDAFQVHSPGFTPDTFPVCYKWTHTPWQDLWMQPQDILLDETIQAYIEHLQFVFTDLLKFTGLVIAEGTSLLPDCIRSLILSESQGMWIVPTEAFQREMYPKRGPFVEFILKQCADQDQALQNWMDRDVAFAHWVKTRTQQLGLRCIRVNGKRSIQENAELVAEHFQLGSINK